MNEGVIVQHNPWGSEVCFLRVPASSTPALYLAPFRDWSLRDKAAQRRLALR